ncbi:hypothetical protein [Streptomyces sp. NPDC056796]|uniref:hypothetical protein n=1 Tax=unclassified Streptomyces TaxID=2593676 RepID=UPI0036798201
MSKPAVPDRGGPRNWARPLALGYVGLVLAVALADEIAGRPPALDTAMALISFPGAGLVLVALLWPAALLTGDDPVTEEAGSSLLTPLFHGSGALVNVLVAWGVLTFVRHFRDEARSSRSR